MTTPTLDYGTENSRRGIVLGLYSLPILWTCDLYFSLAKALKLKATHTCSLYYKAGPYYSVSSGLSGITGAKQKLKDIISTALETKIYSKQLCKICEQEKEGNSYHLNINKRLEITGCETKLMGGFTPAVCEEWSGCPNSSPSSRLSFIFKNLLVILCDIIILSIAQLNCKEITAIKQTEQHPS